MQLLAVMRSAGGEWDGKRALATYKVLGIKSEGVRPLDSSTTRITSLVQAALCLHLASSD
jgi:hypothetical protein